MRSTLLISCLALAACAATGQKWIRADGRDVAPSVMELDKTACEGQTTKALMMGEPRLN